MKTKRKQCENFCKYDYIRTMASVTRTLRKKMKLPPLTRPSKSMAAKTLKKCKKYYCNPSCKGYTDSDFFRPTKPLKNGFHSKLTKKQVETLQKKGALSACVEDFDEYKI
jgi:hypothetical protein